MNRLLSPSLNPTGLGAAIAAIYAAVTMIWNASHHHGVIDPQVIVAALGAAAFLYSRFKVTPVADPKDGNGNPLTPAPPDVTTQVRAEIARIAAAQPENMTGPSNVTVQPPPETHP